MCGALGEALVDAQTTPFGPLEKHLGLLPGESILDHRHQRMTFGTGRTDYPEGTRLLRQAGGLFEVEWTQPAEPGDARWGRVAILHYRGPLSGPTPGPLPGLLGQLREVRDGTAALMEALLEHPPPLLGAIELHLPLSSFAALVARAPTFPLLEYLVVHFLGQDLTEVACDELLERHGWLDRHSSDGRNVVFGVRNQRLG